MSMINEFAEKLIDRLEEELKTAREMQTTQCIGHNGYGTPLQSKLGGEICALLKMQNIVNQLAEEYKDVHDTNVGKWIPVSEKLPDKEEYLKDDGRFIVTDGNRRYQCIYDIYQGSFRTLVLFTNGGIERGWNFEEDKCVIAWQPLPEPYKGKE